MRLECTILLLRYHDQTSGFTVFETVLDRHMEHMTCTMVNPRQGADIILEGEFMDLRKYGRTFVATRVEEKLGTWVSLLSLIETGVIQGMTQALGKKVILQFREKAVEVLDSDIDRLREVKGIGPKTIAKIKESWQEYRTKEKTFVKLQDMGVPAQVAMRIVGKYGRRTEDVVRNDPYCLCTVWGMPFPVIDRAVLAAGMKADDPRRIRGCLRSIMDRTVQEGHVFYPYEQLKDRAVKELGVDAQAVRAQVIDMTLIYRTLDAVGQAIYIPRMKILEAALAEDLMRLAEDPPALELSPSASLPELDGLQEQAVRTMACSAVSVLTGGPGTGKTTVVRRMVEVLEANGLRYELTAPTGRAAKRLAELTGRSARTVHRLLKYRKDVSDGTFTMDRSHPLGCDAVIVDESSMMDMPLMASLLEAMVTGTRLVLVGDVDQLPSVGPGNVLGDMIASGRFPVTELTQVHSQAAGSLIVTNAALIRQGLVPQVNQGDFWHLETPASDIPSVVLGLVRDRLPAYLECTPDDIQVLCLTRHMKDEVNRVLRTGLYGECQGINDSLKVGDRVMQVVNDYTKGVFNGDIGKAVEYDGRELAVDFDGMKVRYDMTELDELQSAFAVTVHKSQGSEYRAVVVCLSPSDGAMLQRNLLYTAVTRARQLLVMVGSWEAVRTCVGNDRRERRCSRLGLLLACS